MDIFTSDPIVFIFYIIPGNLGIYYIIPDNLDIYYIRPDNP